MNKILMIEGSRGVGKTHLIKSLNMDNNIHKNPFANYFNYCFTHDFPTLNKVELNQKPEIHYYSLSYDLTILDLIKTNKINHNLIVDRGLLSSLVFGIQANRITFDQAKNQYKFVEQNYGNFFEIIYIIGNTDKDTRNKDMWSLYNNKETSDLYQKLIDELNIPVTYITNRYDKQSVEAFNSLIKTKFDELPI